MKLGAYKVENIQSKGYREHDKKIRLEAELQNGDTITLKLDRSQVAGLKKILKLEYEENWDNGGFPNVRDT